MKQSKTGSNRDNKNVLIKAIDMQQSLYNCIEKNIAVYLSY